MKEVHLIACPYIYAVMVGGAGIDVDTRNSSQIILTGNVYWRLLHQWKAINKSYINNFNISMHNIPKVLLVLAWVLEEVHSYINVHKEIHCMQAISFSWESFYVDLEIQNQIHFSYWMTWTNKQNKQTRKLVIIQKDAL